MKSEIISLTLLYRAYRKAKFDTFHDKHHFSALQFLNYEQQLDSNLRRLQKRLVDRTAKWADDPELIGSYSFLPKSVDIPDIKDSRVFHSITLNPLRDWEEQCKLVGKLMPANFRQVITPTVDYMIISALWLMTCGDKYDAAIERRLSYAHQLRRVGENGPIALEANALFQHYIYGYKNWRRNGLDAMRASLLEGRSIVAITMDLQSFYHNISPSFLLRASFLNRLGIELTESERTFTNAFVRSINTWYASTPDYKKRPDGAIPVGLSASRVISNVLLAEFDRAMLGQCGAVYYGRYADDIFLVVEKPRKVHSGEQFVKWLRSMMSGWLTLRRQSEGSGLKLQLPYAKDSELVFGSAKQKIFFLSDEHGIDLVDQIGQKVREQSSEFRQLPELPLDESAMASRALLATPDARLEADALRKAEAVSLRRFGFAMLLSDVETYSRDLDPREWRQRREKFYGLVLRYVVTPIGFFDFFIYVTRVFGLMVANRDFVFAIKLMDQFDRVCRIIERTTTAKTTGREKFIAAKKHYRNGFYQAAIQASTVEGFKWTSTFRQLLSRSSGKKQPLLRNLVDISASLLRADLGRRPYHDYWFNENVLEQAQPRLPKDFSVRRVIALTKQFRGKTGLKNPPYWPGIAFGTRPIPLWSLCITAPNLLFETDGLQKVIFATRGGKVADRFSGHKFVRAEDDGSHTIHVPFRTSPKRKIGLPSYLTTDDQWKDAFKGTPDFSFRRYEGIRKLVNRMLRESPGLDYVAFPECSVPLHWALGIAQKLGQRGVSFIAGIENRGRDPIYTNEALVSLASNYFGSNTSLCFIQPKLAPAHREREACQEHHKEFMFPGNVVGRPTYVHGGLCLGVLICSDLTTIAHRAFFQGKLDLLFALEWNQDLATFEFLVESAAHDLHAAIVQVNNREYGDSRIRIPFEKSYKRDVVQVRGGDEDFYVVSAIDFDSLRGFQRDQGSGVEYKPLPIGYSMSDFRSRGTFRKRKNG